ncbi:MAG TPA: cytochrome P450 [Pyrinomonadaceae bacterium]|nr:cytochrome P450 [Pyrinomonadaceae bacterium]
MAVKEQHLTQRYPPGPRRTLPLSGLLAYRKGPLPFFQKLAAQYGDISYFRLGSQEAFFLNHPDYTRDVLVTHHQSFMKGLALQRAKRLLGEGLLTSEGDFHRRQRRLAQPAFHRARVASYANVMTEYAAQTAARWRDGETVDMSEEMMHLTLAIVGKTLFDADLTSDTQEVGEAMAVAMDLFNTISIPFYDLLLKLPLPQLRRFDKARAKLDAIIYRLIEERRSSSEDRGDLLSMLLLAQDVEGDGGTMSNEQLRDELMTIFLAGHETTANALTWTWYLLSQNPEAESKLHAEIDRVLSGRLPTFEDVAQLKYTEMVLTESMRLFPPAWALGRIANEEIEIAGYTVPKKSLVLMSQFVMHHDARYFPDPMIFDPERWTAEARETRPQFSYFPFGGGPRRCLGEGFAWMEGILLVATLAQRWQMRLVPNHPVALRPVITLRPKHGMRMTVIRRQGVGTDSRSSEFEL